MLFSKIYQHPTRFWYQHCTQAQIRFRYPPPFLSFLFFRVDRKSSWPDSRGARRGGGEGGRKGWRKRQVYRARCLNKGSERKQHLQGLARFFFSDDTSRGSVDLSPLSSSLVTALCEFRVYIYVSPPFFFSPPHLVFLFFSSSFSSFFYLWRNKRWRFDEGWVFGLWRLGDWWSLVNRYWIKHYLNPIFEE